MILAVVNAMDPRFDFFDTSIEPTRYLENTHLFEKRAQQALPTLSKMINRPQYSLSLAYTLSVASKLGYEDLDIIRYELDKAGFDVTHTFRPFAYKNICAYVIEKDDMIFLVFRGSNPLNIQNYLTNIDIRMRDVYAPWGYMGRVHKGYFDALGEPTLPPSTSQKEHQASTTSSSFLPTRHQWIQNAMGDTLGYWMHQFLDPIDHRFHAAAAAAAAVDSSANQKSSSPLRHTSMYIQAESYLLSLLQNDPTHQHKKVYITGHSLGAALGTMFLAKMVQSNSPLLQHLGGLYAYGQPKLGDDQFSKIFDAKLSSKIFNHTYNNAYDITLYPPDPYEGTPVPVRPISYLHLSGLMNRHVLQRLPDENWIRILFRVLAPYMINDHFASEYPKCLRSGHVNWVIMGQKTMYSDEDDVMIKRKRPSVNRRRSSRINVADEL
ncbi:Alpha/Beta hydrolase protein [Halteromyces radiatus]|uniref:Alpha/Beta hydrolase protein n=1 Tax=Halteromyces radiatus TaxID=101107 RepID=UPI00221FBE84|nr:Alpha/Beta hydrolase protein [Halteromyces radiatus]KAI8089132.1 Alpha/Beta hydrolase protein [Halteromyces radiatus]